MTNPSNIIEKDGYLVDASTGERVVFYECDPSKNTECDKVLCRANQDDDGDGSFGFCAKTLNPAFKMDGGRSWYAVKKTPEEGEPFWGREYID